MAAQYGKTWWGGQWLEVFKSIDLNDGLSKGRRYAGNGSVCGIHISENMIQAKVKGEKKRPYQVEIHLPKFLAKTQEQVLDILSKTPDLLARLLNHQLPKQIFELLNKNNVLVFPSDWKEVSASCSCLETLAPCKHVSAIIYLLANEIDKNPFLIFSLKGMDLVKTIEKASGLKVSGLDDIPSYTQGWALKPEKIKKIGTEKERGFRGVDLSQIEFLGDHIFHILAPQPLFHRKDFRKMMSGIYARAAKLAMRVDFVEKYKTASVTLRCPEIPIVSVSLMKKRAKKTQKQEDQNGSGRQGMGVHEWDVSRFDRISLIVNENGDFISVDCGESEPSLKNMDSWITFLRQLQKEVPEGSLYFHHALMWHQLYYLALRLVSNQAYVPAVYQTGTKGKETFIRFKPALLNDSVKAALEPLYACCPPDLVIMQPGTLKKNAHSTLFSPNNPAYFAKGQIQIEAALALLMGFFTAQALPEPLGNRGQDEICSLFFTAERFCFDAFENKQYPQVIHDWLHRLYLGERDHPCLQVREVLDGDKKGFCIDIHIEHEGQLKSWNEVLSNATCPPQIRVRTLMSLAMLAEYLPGIEGCYPMDDRYQERKDPKPKYQQDALQDKQTRIYSLSEFTHILLHTLPALKMLGIALHLPECLQNLPRPQLRFLLSATKAHKTHHYLNLENVLRFDWQVEVGNQCMSLDDFSQQVKNSSGLVKIRGQYLMFEASKMQSLLRRFPNLPQTLSPSQWLKVGFSGEIEGVKVVFNEHAQTIFDAILCEEDVPLPEGLNALLRPYQKKGFEWLVKNARVGLGSLLGDEMGLGKTVQLVAFLLHQKMNGDLDEHKALLVVPHGLLTHWRKEIIRFAPALNVRIYKGEKRNLASHDVLLTSYENMTSNHTVLSKTHWKTLVIDGIYHIYDPAGPPSRALKRIKSDVRIGMGGPIEHRLRDYWSLFDFSNKHYLGTQMTFQREYVDKIEKERDQYCLAQFRKMSAPFILSRLKTDEGVFSDLPENMQSQDYCSLSPKQVILYKKMLDANLKEIASASLDIDRKALILKLHEGLKQICNTPDQCLKTPSAEVNDPGKRALFLEIMAEAMNAEQKVLIFTQDRQRGDLLKDALQQNLGLTVPFLCGALSPQKRDEMVDDFQQNPRTRAMILFINPDPLNSEVENLQLIATNQIIFYDTCWDEAAQIKAAGVCIGKNVHVHRLLTENTLEESINTWKMNQQDAENLTLARGEAWLTGLCDAKLRALFSLSSS